MTVTIDAGSRKGYTFAGWTTTDGVVLANASSATTTFTMPARDVTVTANWKPIGAHIPGTGDSGTLLLLALALGLAASGGMIVVGNKTQQRRETLQG